MRNLIIADSVHGESGWTARHCRNRHCTANCTAVELMAKTLRESAEPVTIVSTGPQTNVALLLNSHPELHSKIARIVIMGGAMGLGNWTPAAEFNIYVDPEAAEIVFQSGIPVVMAGLDVTHKAQIPLKTLSVSARLATLFQPLLPNCWISSSNIHKDEKWGFVGAPLRPMHHRWLLKPGCLPLLSAGLAWKHKGIYPV